jgi:hypothetical protein
LILTATHDTDARLEDAIAWRDALANRSYVAVRDGDGHDQLDDACMFDLATDFLENPAVAPTKTECP